jgi:hypothetical protein
VDGNEVYELITRTQVGDFSRGLIIKEKQEVFKTMTTPKGNRKSFRENIKNVPNKIEKEIHNQLNQTRGNIKGPELKELVETALPDEPKYSVRTYEKRIVAYRENHQGNQNKNDLDGYWAVSQWDDGLLPGAVDKLLVIQKLLMSKGHQLTKRRAYLLARIDTSSLEEALESEYPKEKYPNDNIRNLVLLQISSFYTLEEQMADDEVEYELGQPRVHAGTSTPPDAKTPSLDQTFLIDKDVSFPIVLSKWIELYAAPIRSRFKNKVVEYRSNQALNDFINAIIKYNDNGKQAASCVTQPELMELALRWMTLSTRDDLIEPTKYEVRNAEKSINANT